MSARPDHRPEVASIRSWWALWAATLTLAWGTLRVAAADADDAVGWLRSGDYSRAVKTAQEALAGRERNRDWALVLGEALIAVGRYPEARTTMTNALAAWGPSLRLCWLAREAFEDAGDSEGAGQMLQQIRDLIQDQWNYRRPGDLVIFARAALRWGVDPRMVLDRVLATAAQADPKMREVYLARGELALDKHDSALAAKAFEEGLKLAGEDADLHYGLARAYSDSAGPLMAASVEAALKLNPRHVPSLLLVADHLIDAEDYPEAEKRLDEAHRVNPWNPDLWAYRAILAHLRNDPAAEETARSNALHYWKDNPRVDWLIGLKLAQKYRFSEGEQHQRQALAFDPGYLPAKAQRATDLLRLGDEVDGWRLAQEVAKADPYDVEAYNLGELHDSMAKFAAITNDHFVLRMDAHEADVYGPRALALLDRARVRLTAKYGVELARPTYVEIFPNQKDFGVRTFGMPENPGFLGVCFGRVVTATSPSANTSQAVNWEAVLWHEFCHAVTLQLTRNRMPRWLSEGISVYEERQENSSWGQRMNPQYRAMISEGELTPISQLSGAFLAPKTPMHLQFAYYEAELAVEFLVESRGIGALKAVLRDLADGVEVNAALEKRATPMAELERDFTAFVHRRADSLAALEWTKPPPDVFEPGNEDAATRWAGAHPTNYWALRLSAREWVEQGRWEKAIPVLQKSIELYPTQSGTDSAFPLLAEAFRSQGNTNGERAVLAQWAAQDADATPAYLRLMDLGAAAGDWADVARQAQRFLAVNPLVAAPYRRLAEACAAADDARGAIAAWRAVVHLDPTDPAETHFQLALWLRRAGDDGARVEALAALEEAPRHRAALKLLLDLNGRSLSAKASGSPP